MFIRFFFALKEAGVPVTLREFLTLLEAVEQGLAEFRVESFYHLARATLVKDERHFDTYDLVFATQFGGAASAGDMKTEHLPEAWLRKLAEKHLSPEEMAQVEALGGFEKLMETLRKRLQEQKGRHQGGSKWIGTAGTSPFGAYGYNPEGVRIGQDRSRHRRAVKVWDRREFKNLSGDADLGPRNLKMALRRLRRLTREGAEEELDLPATIQATANNGGYLKLKMVPERHNAVKVLLFLDVGGSMEDYVRRVEELFSAARSEFKHLEYFYFHNCLYEGVWKNNRRRHSERISTWDVLHTFPRDYQAIVVGDASMSPYEVLAVHGAIEHWNEETGAVWLQRLTQRFSHSIWLNPVREEHWEYTPSIRIIHQIFSGRMFPLTLQGVAGAIEYLND